jgi:hypothetical protein
MEDEENAAASADAAQLFISVGISLAAGIAIVGAFAILRRMFPQFFFPKCFE